MCEAMNATETAADITTNAPGPLVDVTPRALEELRHLRAKESDPNAAFRVYVEKGGCSGLQYGMVFDEPREGDHVLDHDGVSVLVDAFSADYLRGVRVDFSDDLNDGGFKLSNPNAKQSCGCGRSFEM